MKRTTPLLRSCPLARQSAKRKRLDSIFARKKKAYLAKFPTCMVWQELHDCHEWALMGKIWPDTFGPQASVDVHHKRDSMKYYLDEATWMATSRTAHDFLETHKKLAEARGWIIR